MKHGRSLINRIYLAIFFALIEWRLFSHDSYPNVHSINEEKSVLKYLDMSVLNHLIYCNLGFINSLINQMCLTVCVSRNNECSAAVNLDTCRCATSG